MTERRLRFASWAAVSTKEQFEKVSIPDQLRINREHAEARGGEVVAELIVPGESRSIVLFEDACRAIEAYAQLRTMIAERSFDVLIFRDRTRLGRTVSLVTSVTELCREAGIVLYDVESPPDSLHAAYTYDDQLIGAIKAVGAQREVAEIKRRHMHGMIGRTKKGLLSAGTIYGYQRVYDERGRFVQMVQVEPQASIVRRIFDQYLAGVGSHTIALDLNAEGIETPRKSAAWSGMTVLAIIANAWKYAGYAEVNAYYKRTVKAPRQYVRVKSNWVPIITDEEAERSLEERRQRRTNPYLAGTHNILSGICVCAVCGGLLYFNHYQERRNDDGSYYYLYMRCQRHKPSLSCQVKIILAELRNWLTMLHDAAPELPEVTEVKVTHDLTSRLDERISRQESDILRDKAALVRLDNAYADGILDLDRYRQQVGRLTERIEESERHLAALEEERRAAEQSGETGKRLAEVAERGTSILDAEDVTAANAWLRHRLQIVVTSGHVVRIRGI